MRKALLHIAFLCCATHLHAFQVDIFANPAHCGLNNGTASASANGGTPPYSYVWSNGATTAYIQNLAPGDYTVIATDALGGTAQNTATIAAQPNMSPYVQIRDACGFGTTCNGRVQINSPGFQGTPPFTYSIAPDQCLQSDQYPGPNGSTYITPLEGNQTYTITVTDANGCTGSTVADIWQIPGPYQHVATSIQPACGTASNGGFIIAHLGGWTDWHVTGPNGYYQTFLFNTGPYVFTGLEAGTYTATRWSPVTSEPYWCEAPATVVVPSIGPPCGTLSGQVFHDADQDCVFGGADVMIPGKVMTIEPGPNYALTLADGSYSMNLPYGNFSIAQALNNEVQLCPANDPVPFALAGGSADAFIDFADSSTIAHDLSIHLVSSAARPGFTTVVWITVMNNSAYPSGDVTMDLSFDPLLLNPQPATGQWSIGPIMPYASTTVSFTAMVPADIGLIGTALLYNALATNTATETNTANNAAFHSRTITASYDPNDKQGTTSSALSPNQYFLLEDAWVDYTVRFQNTGTAAAETVVIRDELDTDLDVTSLEILGASHAFTPSFGQGRELIFTFNNINLPDSTTDLLGSQGFVSYRIKPNNDIVIGDVLENTAGIYFDFNPPIITNTTSHVVDFSTHVSLNSAYPISIHPNPADDRIVVNAPSNEIASIRLIGTDGRSVRSFGKGQVSLDLSHVRPGAYMVEIILRNGTHHRQHLIIQ